jgi:hypothetical protein
MADYGLEFTALEGVSKITSSFSNYSVLSVFNASVNSGINTITLPTQESTPLIAVRHPGLDVGFIQFIDGSSTQVKLYSSGTGTINFVVFTPSQTVGNTGFGLKINDVNGNEIYHSDLKYLNVSDLLTFNSSLNGSYYILGSYYGIDNVFTDNLSSTVSPPFPITTLVCGNVCVPSYTYPYDDICYFDCWWEVIGYEVYHSYKYWVYVTKNIYCVRHDAGDNVSAVTHSLGTYEVYYKDDSGLATGVDLTVIYATLGIFEINSYEQQVLPDNVSSFPNQLLTSNMDYA